MTVQRIAMGGGMSAQQAQAVASGVASALTATGTTQATAYAVTLGTSYFSTVAASSGALLPSAAPGDEFWVHNAGANALTVYPNTSARINAVATNGGVSVGVNTSCVFKCISATQYVANMSA